MKLNISKLALNDQNALVQSHVELFDQKHMKEIEFC